MKRLLCLIVTSFLFLSGCSTVNQPVSSIDTSSTEYSFTTNDKGNIVSSNGVEYSFLASEVTLYYLGELEFLGSVQGEEKVSHHLDLAYQTGMFAIKDAPNDNILIRCFPNNEWRAIYRKTSLSDFDFSVDNCTKLEFVKSGVNGEHDIVHTQCSDGIKDKFEISAILTEIRKQKSPRDAGLYDLIKKPDGMLENCYVYGTVYGFFAEEPNLVVYMEVKSFNDLAYSICIEENEYVLPKELFNKLTTNNK